MGDQALGILQVSTADIQGGAERVGWDLFTAYRARGYKSWLAVGQKRSADPDVFIIPNQALYGRWYRSCQAVSSQMRRWEAKLGWGTTWSGLAASLSDPRKWLDSKLGIEDFHFRATGQLLDLPPARPDIVHTHNLHGDYFDLRRLPHLSQQVPLIVTLHDAWMLSGHCAHSLTCERWLKGCGRCPDLTIYPAIRRDATRYNWRRKQEIYARARLHVATPSHWLMRKVERSMLAPAIIDARVLPNGVDLQTYFPGDKRAARCRLGLEQEARIVLAVGVGIRDSRWKDYTTLRDAMARLAAGPAEQNLVLIALGGDAAARETIGQTEVQFIPFQTDPHTVADYYRAADVYVHAAHADTFPTSILESMACGTPVVATRVGGIPEQVEDGRNGFLVPPADVVALTARLSHVLESGDIRGAMAHACAETARQKFGIERQVDAYLDWYHELADGGPAQPHARWAANSGQPTRS